MLSLTLSPDIARQVLASGQTLTVHLVGFADGGVMKHQLERFKRAALHGLHRLLQLQVLELRVAGVYSKTSAE